jgi:hypothetical protein
MIKKSTRNERAGIPQRRPRECGTCQVDNERAEEVSQALIAGITTDG